MEYKYTVFFEVGVNKYLHIPWDRKKKGEKGSFILIYHIGNESKNKKMLEKNQDFIMHFP